MEASAEQFRITFVNTQRLDENRNHYINRFMGELENELKNSQHLRQDNLFDAAFGLEHKNPLEL